LASLYRLPDSLMLQKMQIRLCKSLTQQKYHYLICYLLIFIASPLSIEEHTYSIFGTGTHSRIQIGNSMGSASQRKMTLILSSLALGCI
jgi:hypothetical protein